MCMHLQACDTATCLPATINMPALASTDPGCIAHAANCAAAADAMASSLLQARAIRNKPVQILWYRPDHAACIMTNVSLTLWQSVILPLQTISTTHLDFAASRTHEQCACIEASLTLTANTATVNNNCVNAVALISLQAQLQAGATSNKPMQMLQYGPDGPVDSSKCTAVAFIPGSEGSVFAAAHWSGTVIIHIKVHTVLQYAVAFIAGSEGYVFAAARWSGTVIIHIKVHTYNQVAQNQSAW